MVGFTSGAVGAKALSSNFVKKYAKISNQKIKANLKFSLKNIAKNNKNFILQNPQGFIQELDKKNIRELLESKGNIQMSVGDGRQSLASEVANMLVSTASKISEKDKKVLQNFNKFVKSSLTDSRFNGNFNLGAIKQENIKRLKKIKNDKGQITEFNLNGYTLKIDSNHIRHIKIATLMI